MPNALAHESSPYLLQHRDNPVDWLPWGERALARAREEDRPLLVSIGYSACHWCHVMERESFEDPETAALMNERFVCVKVDREERPDVDAIYMEAVQALTGHGGWPLNVFLAPDQTPFFGGTYWPPEPRHGMPSFRAVLRAVADAWATRRDELLAQGARLAPRLAGAADLAPSDAPLTTAALDAALAGLEAGYDRAWGGWGATAPKFPAASTIELLLARAAVGDRRGLPMALHTLERMASGGIYDQVGGGFARYAVDRTWTVPHFEKMLYDNALLARAYLHGHLVAGDERLRRVCVETLDFLARELRGPEGGFCSALDADSEGVEGRFYVWTLDELAAALAPEDLEAAIAWTGATARGNHDGANVLEARGPEPPAGQRERIRGALLRARAARTRPGLDDKRLTAWNALALAAFADAGAALGRADYLDVARGAARFVLERLRAPDGRLLRSWRDGRGRLNAYLEDHAFLLEALIVLYEATFEPEWFAAARATAEEILARFADERRGGFFSTSSDHEALVARRKDLEDHPIPAGASSATVGLLRLAALTGDRRYEQAALGHLRLVGAIAPRHPTAFAHLLRGLDLHLRPPREVALAGDDVAPLAAVVRARLRPDVVLAGPPDAGDVVPLMAGRVPVDGRPAAYVCEGFACRAPVTSADALRALLDGPPREAPA
jgi:uncharacterized protein YyaL (SSP411 family)